jgi:hypothetical protein
MKLQTFWAGACSLLLALPASALEIVFKDGTVLKNAEVYVPPPNGFSTGGPTIFGINLTVNGKLYIHHFPFVESQIEERAVDDDDDGIYELRKVTKAVTHYRPPVLREHAPREFGYSCTPSRLPFIHFNEPTLAKLRQNLSQQTLIAPQRRARLAGSIDLALRHKPQPHELHTPQAAAKWQQEADRDVRLYPQKIFYGKWIKK